MDGLAAIAAAADTHRALAPPPGMPIGDDGELGDGRWLCEPVSFER
jgi:hypothetical protein